MSAAALTIPLQIVSVGGSGGRVTLRVAVLHSGGSPDLWKRRLPHQRLVGRLTVRPHGHSDQDSLPDVDNDWRIDVVADAKRSAVVRKRFHCTLEVVSADGCQPWSKFAGLNARFEVERVVPTPKKPAKSGKAVL